MILYLCTIVLNMILAGMTKTGNCVGDNDCVQQQPLNSKSVIEESALLSSTSPPPAPAAPTVEVRWHNSFCMPAAFSCFKV